jgi:hypothetical protein
MREPLGGDVAYEGGTSLSTGNVVTPSGQEESPWEEPAEPSGKK